MWLNYNNQLLINQIYVNSITLNRTPVFDPRILYDLISYYREQIKFSKNQMKLYPIETGNFKLDGGAMFGVVPKSIWQKTNPADNQNKIELAMRALLIEDGGRLILIDCGIGNKQSDKFFGYYDLWGDYDLETALAQYGFSKDDVTDVFLTHLHFDHCGGAVQVDKENGGYELAFRN